MDYTSWKLDHLTKAELEQKNVPLGEKEEYATEDELRYFLRKHLVDRPSTNAVVGRWKLHQQKKKKKNTP